MRNDPTRTAVCDGTNDPAYEGIEDADLFVWWCPHCRRQTERQWHTVRRGPALIPQLDEEHYCVKVPVRAALTSPEART